MEKIKNSNMIYRELVMKDFEDVLFLEKQLYELHYSHRRDLFDEMRNVYCFFSEGLLESLINDEDSLCMGCVVDNKVVGVLIAKRKYAGSVDGFKKRQFIYVNDLIVDKDYRRRGIAKKMFEQLKNDSFSKDCDSIELNVWAFNMESLKFYESLGMSVKEVHYEMKMSRNNIDNIEKEEILIVGSKQYK